MPEVSGGYEPASGPLLRLAIWPGDAAREILSGAPPNTRAFRSYIALLDSGADVTCISPRVVEELAISPFGKVLLEGVNEVVLTNLFEFGIGLPPGEQENLEQSLGDGRDLHVEFVEQGAEWAGGSKRIYDVLLGRDVMCKGTFVMTNDGRFALTI